MVARKCLLVDDSIDTLMVLEQYMQRLPLFECITARTYMEAVEILRSEPIDLLFLDVELPDFSGLTLLTTLSTIPPTILISSHMNYAVDSYTIGKSADFLLKPIEFERCLSAVTRALSIHISSNSFQDLDYILLKTGRTFNRFNYDDIDYIEAYSIYVKIYQNGVVYIVNEMLGDLLEKLKKRQFIRVHKSYVINIKKITGFGHDYFFVNEQKVPIGHSYKPKLESLFKLFDRDK